MRIPSHSVKNSFMPMPPEHVEYLAKYLAKDRPDCLKRWPLWAAFGKTWEPTKVKDI